MGQIRYIRRAATLVKYIKASACISVFPNGAGLQAKIGPSLKLVMLASMKAVVEAGIIFRKIA